MEEAPDGQSELCWAASQPVAQPSAFVRLPGFAQLSRCVLR